MHSRADGLAAFGDDQAEARVLALMLLKRLAFDGDTAPLRQNIAHLRDEIVAGADLPKAADKDFVDMIADYAEIRGAAPITADLRGFLAEVGYQDTLKRYYRRAIFLALGSAMQEQQYHKTLGFLYQNREQSNDG